MKKRKNFIQYIMLCVSFIMLTLYILPHHHHQDGRACYSLNENTEDSHHSNNEDSCSGTAHHLFFKTSLSNDEEVTLSPYYILLTILSDPFTELIPQCCSTPFGQLQGIYREKLHDLYHVLFNGLRAPPVYN